MKRLGALLITAVMLCGCSISTVPTVIEDFEEPSTEPEIVTTEASTTEEPTTEPPTEPPSPAEIKLSQMTLHEKVCQMFIAVPEALDPYMTVTELTDNFRNGYAEYPIGGIILFDKNIVSYEQTSQLLADTQAFAVEQGVGMFMSVDEEGGAVTRVQQRLGTEAVSSMYYIGAGGDTTVSEAAGNTIGGYLSELGFNVDFAPVADVNISPYNELGTRIFSTDPTVVADMTAAFSRGLQSRGVCSTLKHFPGLGAGSGNTHYGSVWIDRTHEQLCETEFTAFRGGIESGCDFVMVGHQITAASGDELPGDISKVVVGEWLRGELGFDGIAITDSQSMGAIANVYTAGDAAVLSIEAGIDMILMPSSLSEAVEGVKSAVNSGRLPESRIDESVLRILEKKEKLSLIHNS